MVQKTINGKKYLIMELDESIELDMLAIHMLEENTIDGLLPFRSVKSMDEKYFRYECKEGIPLSEWLLEVHSKKEVIRLLESLLIVNEETEAYLLEINHLCTSVENVIVQNMSCLFPYIPYVEYCEGDMLKLVREILSKVKYARDEEFTYIFDLLNAFSRGEISNILDLKKWIKNIQSNTTVYKESPSIVQVPKCETKQNIEKLVEVPKRESVPTNSLFAAFGDNNNVHRQEDAHKKKKNGLFFKEKNNGQKTKENVQSKVEVAVPLQNAEEVVLRKVVPEVINEVESDDQTVITPPDINVYLIRCKDGMEYLLDNISYVIGSGNSADILIRGNTTISRKHAKIYQERNEFFIVDEGSTNGTYIDGTRLLLGCPCLLQNKMHIQLSDEDFLFEIRG